MREALAAFSAEQDAIADARGEGKYSEMEITLYRGKWFTYSLYCFVLAFVVMAFSWLTPASRTGGVLILIASLLAVLGLALDTYGITLRSIIRQRPPIRVGDVARWIPLAPGDRRILALLNLRPALVEQIQACISREDRRGTVIGPEAVRVDTIHASKGLEAPAVLLHTGYLSGLVTGLADPERMAEERRVYFVGATRASHALILFDYITPEWPGFGRPT